MSETDAGEGRREFLRALGRGAALAALAGIAVVLAFKRPPDAQGARCANRAGCGNCPSLGRCALPQAADARGGVRGK